MKINEKDAIINYLEFQLLVLIESVEKHISDPDVINELYDNAYKMLVDVDDTISVSLLLSGENMFTDN